MFNQISKIVNKIQFVNKQGNQINYVVFCTKGNSDVY